MFSSITFAKKAPELVQELLPKSLHPSNINSPILNPSCLVASSEVSLGYGT